ncbi:ABC transporter ATP-binding protein/permease [Patescibacteria group bacterium]|nr:ABC transporter ATP-binding protein/permease [Patescibacteria group bacterium]
MKISKDIKTLWKYVRKYKKKVYFIAFISLITAFIGASIPYIYGRLVDIAINKTSEVSVILQILSAWLVLALFSDLLDRYVTKKSVDIGTLSGHDLTLSLTNHIMKLPVSFHKDRKMGEIIQRISRAGNHFTNIITETVFNLIPDLLRLVIILVIMAFVQWHLSLGVFIILLLYSIVTFFKTKPILKGQKVLNKAGERGYGALYDSAYNFQLVKSSIAEKFENLRNTRNFNKISIRYRKLMKKWMDMSAWQQTIIKVGFVSVFGLSIFFLRSGVLSPGELVMFVGYTNLVFQPVIHLAQNYRRLRQNMVVISRALSLFDTNPEKYDEGINLKDIKGEIIFKDVGFNYKKKQDVLKNISFKAKAGQVIALVGESGVGKTTLADLISRYYSPTKGNIYIDGKNLEKVNINSLRKNIAMVPQEISLFNDTIKNNIAYTKSKATEKELIEVAKAANAHRFIIKFPNKYKQLVGERGIKLSTGQKQRIAIARALLRDPKILILDEATSSLDSESERLVQQALKRLIKGRTTFIIAHRLSTISHADKILVLEKGKIVESGTHKKLMKKNGIYRKFFLMQSA